METQTQDMKSQVSGVFDRAAPTYDQVGPHFFTHFGQRLVELADLPPGAKVLDIATGRGAVLFPTAAQIGPDGFVIGVDLSSVMVQETKAQLAAKEVKNARVLVMDGEQPEFPDASFDAVLCGFGIFFFPKPELALQEYYRVLKPGGLLGFSTWGQGDERWKWLENLGPLVPPGAPPPKVVFDSPAGLTAFVSAAGFGQVRVVHDELDCTYQDEDEWLNTQWSHGVRALLERIPPERLEAMKPHIFAQMQPLKEADGIHQLFRALFTFAIKPV